MRALFVALLLVAAQAIAADTPLQLDDFAYGMTLIDGNAGAIYSLDVPEEVYQHVTRADLGDMRVFNADGEVVPMQLLQPVTPADEVRHAVSLPFFPLYSEAGKQAGETTLRIVPDKKGALIDLHARAGKEHGKEISRYIIDASSIVDEQIRHLRLQWNATNEAFVTNITVDGSNDLNSWSRLANGSVAELTYEGYKLQRNEIELDGNVVKYLRINWPMGEKKVTLRSVTVDVSKVSSETPLHWTAVQGMKGDGTSGHYLFDTAGYYPVERVDIVLPEQNSLVQARLLSSSNITEKHWVPRFQGVLYSLQQKGQNITSGTISTGLVSQRYWLLDVNQQSGGLGRGEPQMKIGWRPPQILFVARGKGPFTLAFGSVKADALPINSNLDAVVSDQQWNDGGDLVKTITPQAMHELGGAARLRPPPPPLPWQKWLLWIVLIMGVLAMLIMARSLYRQMSSGKGGA